jgi:hypothetical protein
VILCDDGDRIGWRYAGLGLTFGTIPGDPMTQRARVYPQFPGNGGDRFADWRCQVEMAPD